MTNWKHVSVLFNDGRVYIYPLVRKIYWNAHMTRGVWIRTPLQTHRFNTNEIKEVVVR